ncbi:Uncharacterised protein [Stenotrophomonas maltophilia]|nr:Uncharacterised protein [Stenotrophomonas maltophilia]
MRSALRALRPKRCCATFGPLPLPASPRPCRGSPSTEGLVAPDPSMGFRRAGMPGRLYLAEATGGGCEVRCARFAPNVAAQRSGPSPCRPLPAPVGAAPQQRGLLLQSHQWVSAVRDAWSAVPRRSHWRGMRSALRALRPKRCCATFGPLPLPASPRPCRGSPQQRGLLLQIHQWVSAVRGCLVDRPASTFDGRPTTGSAPRRGTPRFLSTP